MRKGQRPSRHIRRVRTKKGRRPVLVNKKIKKPKKYKSKKVSKDEAGEFRVRANSYVFKTNDLNNTASLSNDVLIDLSQKAGLSNEATIYDVARLGEVSKKEYEDLAADMGYVSSIDIEVFLNQKQGYEKKSGQFIRDPNVMQSLFLGWLDLRDKVGSRSDLFDLLIKRVKEGREGDKYMRFDIVTGRDSEYYRWIKANSNFLYEQKKKRELKELEKLKEDVEKSSNVLKKTFHPLYDAIIKSHLSSDRKLAALEEDIKRHDFKIADENRKKIKMFLKLITPFDKDVSDNDLGEYLEKNKELAKELSKSENKETLEGQAYNSLSEYEKKDFYNLPLLIETKMSELDEKGENVIPLKKAEGWSDFKKKLVSLKSADEENGLGVPLAFERVNKFLSKKENANSVEAKIYNYLPMSEKLKVKSAKDLINLIEKKSKQHKDKLYSFRPRFNKWDKFEKPGGMSEERANFYVNLFKGSEASRNKEQFSGDLKQLYVISSSANKNNNSIINQLKRQIDVASKMKIPELRDDHVGRFKGISAFLKEKFDQAILFFKNNDTVERNKRLYEHLSKDLKKNKNLFGSNKKSEALLMLKEKLADENKHWVDAEYWDGFADKLAKEKSVKKKSEMLKDYFSKTENLNSGQALALGLLGNLAKFTSGAQLKKAVDKIVKELRKKKPKKTINFDTLHIDLENVMRSKPTTSKDGGNFDLFPEFKAPKSYQEEIKQFMPKAKSEFEAAKMFVDHLKGAPAAKKENKQTTQPKIDKLKVELEETFKKMGKYFTLKSFAILNKYNVNTIKQIVGDKEAFDAYKKYKSFRPSDQKRFEKWVKEHNKKESAENIKGEKKAKKEVAKVKELRDEYEEFVYD